MKLTAEQLQALAGLDLPADQVAQLVAQLPKEPTPPGPYEIALAFSTALLSTGKYEDPGAAIGNAWRLVLTFYQGKKTYLDHANELHQIARAPRQVIGAAAVGGETGNIGEVSTDSGAVAVKVDPQREAYWTRIHETTAAVVAAQARLEEARAKRDAIPAGKRNADRYQAADHEVDEAQRAFNEAAAAQSKAYE